MCLMKIVNLNRKYRSQQPNLNKLETRPTGDSTNKIWMISGQWFYRRRFLKNWPKIAQNYPWRKSVQRFERRSWKTRKVHADNDDNDYDDDGHRVIARVTLTRWVWLKRGERWEARYMAKRIEHIIENDWLDGDDMNRHVVSHINIFKFTTFKHTDANDHITDIYKLTYFPIKAIDNCASHRNESSTM